MYQSQFIEMFGKSSLTIEMQECFSMIRNGANIKQGQVEGGFPITRIETISDETIDREKMGYAGIIDNKYESYYLQEGDILVSHINSMKHIGKCALYCKQEDEIIIHGMNLLCLRPIREIVVPAFAIHMLRSDIIKKQIADITKPAVNQASFSVRDFGGIKAIIPNNDEQNKFVAIAQQADKSKFSCLKSQFIEMFGGNKVDYVQLSSLCSTFIDGDWIESKDQSESGIRLIQTGNVGCGEYKDKGDKAKYITEDTFNKLHCTEIYPGDILISRLPDPVGRACVLPEGLGKCVTAVDCTIIRFSEKILPNFFVAYTNTPEYLTQIKSTLAGTTRLRVSRGNLGKVKIPVPSIEQQRTFVSIAEQADKSKQIAFSRAS